MEVNLRPKQIMRCQTDSQTFQTHSTHTAELEADAVKEAAAAAAAETAAAAAEPGYTAPV